MSPKITFKASTRENQMHAVVEGIGYLRRRSDGKWIGDDGKLYEMTIINGTMHVVEVTPK